MAAVEEADDDADTPVAPLSLRLAFGLLTAPDALAAAGAIDNDDDAATDEEAEAAVRAALARECNDDAEELWLRGAIRGAAPMREADTGVADDGAAVAAAAAARAARASRRASSAAAMRLDST